MKVYYAEDITQNFLTGEEPVRVSRDDYTLMGDDSGAGSVEDVFVRWQAGSEKTAEEFDRRRICTECPENPVFESVEEAIAAHDGNLIDGYTDDTIHGDGGHRVIGWPRSLSVGDVVDTGEGLKICAPVGWKDAEWD